MDDEGASLMYSSTPAGGGLETDKNRRREDQAQVLERFNHQEGHRGLQIVLLIALVNK